jgi:hypothetical protein
MKKLTPKMEKNICDLIRNSHIARERPAHLKEAETEYIRAGIAGGLPWDVQVSDGTIGCMPLNNVCYGQCFAAHLANKQGVDFGKRVERILNEDLLRRDLRKMPDQKWLRYGWNSDPSWNWDKAIRVGEIAKEFGKLTVYNTKFRIKPSQKQLRSLLGLEAEIRLSVSAMDNQEDFDYRFGILREYRDMGGAVACTVITSKYRYPELNQRQEELIQYLWKNDIPSGEMPFRASSKPGTGNLMAKNALRVPGSTDKWFGRLFPEKLFLPVLASISPHYNGLKTNSLAKLDRGYIKSITQDEIPTYQELLSGKGILPDKIGKAPIYNPK